MARLRRSMDEPLAVADREAHHMATCARCRARKDQISSDAAFAQRILSSRVLFQTPTWPGLAIRGGGPEVAAVVPLCRPDDPVTGVLWAHHWAPEQPSPRVQPCSPALPLPRR